jgi:hypothetical protein
MIYQSTRLSGHEALTVLNVILQHWAKRMGNKNINVKTSRGTNMSTVGVDIGDWVFEKKIRGQSSYGPVVFRYCPNTGFLK